MPSFVCLPIAHLSLVGRLLGAPLLTLALFVSGCGTDPEVDAGADADAGPVADAGRGAPDAMPIQDAETDAGDPVRFPCGSLADCPERPCEIASVCSDEGFCDYEPFVCASPGGVCPVLVCQGHSGTAGELVNTCVEMTGAACGAGGTCSGTRCVVPATGLRLVEGGLRAGSVGGTVRGAGGRSFAIDGHLGFITSRGAPRSSGRVRLTGGIRP